MEIFIKIKSLYEKYQKKILIIGILTIFVSLLVLLIINYTNKKQLNVEEPEEIEKIAIEVESNKIEEEITYYLVDIKGEVNNPGVYKLNKNSRVIDAINASGGLKDNANTRYINLSKFITDEMVIIIYSNDEIINFKEKETIIIPCECEELNNDSCLENNLSKENNLININTASIEELITLNGIGESKANAIIDYRENEKFEAIEEITEVSGISDALYSKIKDYITV